MKFVFKVKQEKGVTMVALVITIIILIILTNVLVYNAQDSIHIKKLNNLYNDLATLRSKVSIYYNEYGKIPAKTKYTNINSLNEVLSSTNDTGDFYVIDLQAMQGLTLNYGKEYEKVKNTDANVDTYTDLYIINENSHNIFYIRGVTIKEKDASKTYYTDYIAPDDTTVDLRSVDGILIPNGYYYIGKIKDSSGNESIVISNTKNDPINTASTNQYVWTKQISKITEKSNSVTLSTEQQEYQFVESTNQNQGYFKNSEGKVQYTIIDEKSWSEPYTQEMSYTDRNGDKITIPEGFRISMAATMNTLENGFVVKDKNDNEWVWVEVPSEIFTSADNDSDYDKIQADLIAYAKDYREGKTGQGLSWKDEWYEGCGLTQTEYNNTYHKMLASVYNNDGFWIGRYEAGIKGTNTLESTTGRTSHTDITSDSQDAVSQPDMIPYNYIYCSEAQTLANKMSANTNKTSSLLFGIQWDLTCKFLEVKSNLDKPAIKTDSKNWGNYKNVSFDITSSLARTYGSPWTAITGTKEGNDTTTVSKLLTTGASKKNSILNIYDFAGNEWEWTLEHATSSTSDPCARRGGNYNSSGADGPAAVRSSISTSSSNGYIGFRPSLY